MIQKLTLDDRPGNTIVVYHGGSVKVENPKVIRTRFAKDFGFGFYVTKSYEQARKWALRKAASGACAVSRYLLDPSYSQLDYLCFETESVEWLNFIAAARSGTLIEGPAIVEGPMADDTVWDYLNDYVAGRLSADALLELCKFRHKTHQIAFTTDDAISKVLKFDGYEVFNAWDVGLV